jgi:hypothetical protein
MPDWQSEAGVAIRCRTGNPMPDWQSDAGLAKNAHAAQQQTVAAVCLSRRSLDRRRMAAETLNVQRSMKGGNKTYRRGNFQAGSAIVMAPGRGVVNDCPPRGFDHVSIGRFD